ncbi:MAG TPA: hypothetical protein VGI78_14230 [Acetobacteraceae bacterium]|jgi:hypothetical protein
MLRLSFGLLLTTAVLGGLLAALRLRSRNASAGWIPGVLHGVCGVIGLIALLFALRGPPRGEAMGVASFGRIAALLLTIALVAGLAILVLRLRRHPMTSLIIGIHATIAIAGIVMLAAYTLVG